MTTIEQQANCPTCYNHNISSPQYKIVPTYTPEKRESTVSEKKPSVEFMSLDFFDRKNHIRKLNELVSNWR